MTIKTNKYPKITYDSDDEIMGDNLIDKVYAINTREERCNLTGTSQNCKDEISLLRLVSATYSNLTK